MNKASDPPSPPPAATPTAPFGDSPPAAPTPLSAVLVTESFEAVRWTIRRPTRLNGLGPTVIGELLTLVSTLAADRTLILEAEPVLRTNHHPVWIAGGDLQELNALQTRSDVTAFVESIHRFIEWCENRAGPVILLVDGQAIGGGAEFALTGDIRLATQRSSWQFKQGALGLTTGFGGGRRLVELVGPTRAESLVYGQKTVSSDDALAWGLVHEVAPDRPALETLASEWSARLQKWHGPSFAAQKKMFHRARHSVASSHRVFETELFVSIWSNPYHRSQMEKFLSRK